MIPTVNDILTADLAVKSQPSKTYAMQLETNRITGTTDGLDAVKQAVFKILNTERFQYIIYSWNYGVEFIDLYGKDVDYVCSEVQRRITEGLMMDDRIIGVDGFVFDTSIRHAVICRFTVHSVFGNFENEKVVEV